MLIGFIYSLYGLFSVNVNFIHIKLSQCLKMLH